MLNQRYPDYEIVIVDDASTDNSAAIILDFQKKYPILHLLKLANKSSAGKKEALTQGIQAAKHEVLLLTDADCFPASSYWIDSMVSRLVRGNEIVLGFSPYWPENGFLNKWIRFETIYSAVQYFSFALSGMPYMGVGRNLLYTKSLFLRNRGFSGHRHLASGDDDLFINQSANRHNCGINLDPGSFVFSLAKSEWKRYYYQKTRHLTTATSYRPTHQWLLGLLAWSHLWFYAGGILLLLLRPQSLPLVCIFFTVRMGLIWYTYRRILKKLQSESLWRWVPLFDLLYCLFYLVFVPALINTGKRNTWT
jgi:glycosyltransferase involved in cell wall biosynthesis